MLVLWWILYPISNNKNVKAANLDQSCDQQDYETAFGHKHWRSVARWAYHCTSRGTATLRDSLSKVSNEIRVNRPVRILGGTSTEGFGEWFNIESMNLVRLPREACYDQKWWNVLCPGWNADTLETSLSTWCQRVFWRGCFRHWKHMSGCLSRCPNVSYMLKVNEFTDFDNQEWWDRVRVPGTMGISPTMCAVTWNMWELMNTVSSATPGLNYDLMWSWVACLSSFVARTSCVAFSPSCFLSDDTRMFGSRHWACDPFQPCSRMEKFMRTLPHLDTDIRACVLRNRTSARVYCRKVY